MECTVEKLEGDYEVDYNRKAILLNELASEEKKLTESKKAYETAKAALFVNGDITGKNEAERAAQVTSALVNYQSEIDRAQFTVDDARLNLSLANLDIELCDKLLRLLELNSRQ